MDKLDSSDSIVLVDEPVFLSVTRCSRSFTPVWFGRSHFFFTPVVIMISFCQCAVLCYLFQRRVQSLAVLENIALSHIQQLVGSRFGFLVMHTHVSVCVFACMCSCQ